jgi:hypothetical protein
MVLEQPEVIWIRTILQFGPVRLREKERRDQAIAILSQHGLARLETRDGRKYLVLNPKTRT